MKRESFVGFHYEPSDKNIIPYTLPDADGSLTYNKYAMNYGYTHGHTNTDVGKNFSLTRFEDRIPLASFYVASEGKKGASQGSRPVDRCRWIIGVSHYNEIDNVWITCVNLEAFGDHFQNKLTPKKALDVSLTS